MHKNKNNIAFPARFAALFSALAMLAIPAQAQERLESLQAVHTPQFRVQELGTEARQALQSVAAPSPYQAKIDIPQPEPGTFYIKMADADATVTVKKSPATKPKAAAFPSPAPTAVHAQSAAKAQERARLEADLQKRKRTEFAIRPEGKGTYTYGRYVEELIDTSEKPAVLPLAPGDFTFVSADAVNLRPTADTKGKPLARMMRGSAFIVLERKGSWLYGSVYRMGGLEGWIHEDYLSIDYPEKATPPTTVSYLEFRDFVESLEAASKRETGLSRYLDVRNWGDGIVAVVVSRAFMDDSYSVKKANFDRMRAMWDYLDGNRQPEKLFVISPSGFIILQN